jgi:predicted phage terminase large subunit-like protein
MDNGVKSARKNLESRYNRSDYLKMWLPEGQQHFTDSYIEFTNRSNKKLGIRMFGAKTGLRGTKIFGKRPTLAVMDDLVSDEDSKSKVSLEAIKATIYKGVFPALHPTKRKIIFNGTPFNKNDPLVEAVESGAWHTNVWPVCETFPCSRKDFKGAWEDRFTFDSIKGQYDTAVKTGQTASFMQEYMLRITSEEERLVQDGEIREYPRVDLLANKQNFNFYITTDWAVSTKQSADFTCIAVWAYSANGDWFWVDGIHERQTMDKSIDDLFRLVREYRPQQVAVEVTGQQGGFLSLIQREMLTRNIWFNFTMGKGGQPGIRPVADKLTRFNTVVPLFKAGKVHFPQEMKTSAIVSEFRSQISLVTVSGIKSKHDDALDTISQLGELSPWKPSEAPPLVQEDGRWDFPGERIAEVSAMTSYVV